MYPTSPLLLADFADVIGALVAILLPIIILASQVFGKQNKPVNPPQGRPPVGGRPPRAAGGPKRPAGVEHEIEQFLKRVVQQRGGQQAPDVEVAKPRPPKLPGQRKSLSQQTAMPKRTPPVPARRATPARPPIESPEVQTRHLNSPGERGTGLRQHHLSSSVEQRDERMEEHLEGVFDHDLGRLSHESQKKPVLSAEPQGISQVGLGAASFAAMLKNSRSLKQAIVLSEILSRPEDRWS